MGLDISLVKIEEKEIKEMDWLIASESPELEDKFSMFKRRRHFQYPDENYYDDVYYYSDISYQRKGVTKDFYEKAENDKCIVDKNEVEKLIKLVDKKLRDDFKLNFVDKFVEGQTFVIVSW